MKVGLVQIGGSLPNVALMRLSTWHKQLGDEVVLGANAVDTCDAVFIIMWNTRGGPA